MTDARAPDTVETIRKKPVIIISNLSSSIGYSIIYVLENDDFDHIKEDNTVLVYTI